MNLPNSLRGLGDYWERSIASQFPKRASNYQAPSSEECQMLKDTVILARQGDLDQAQDLATKLGCQLNTLQLGGESFLLLEEQKERKGWGKVLFRENASSNLVIEVPHPVADRNTPELGMLAFDQLEADAYILAGAHRANRAEPSPDVPGHTLSDMTHTKNTAFQAFHEGMLEPGTHVLQLHGFSAQKGHQADPEFPLSRELVLSDGADDKHDPPLLKALGMEFSAAGFDASVVSFDSQANSRLGATTNVQRDQMEDEQLVPTSEFLHLEVETKLRKGPQRDENFRRIVEVLETAVKDDLR